jgi:hypothetical protein
MAMLSAWLLFPLVLGAVALGCGLLVEELARTRVRGELLVPLGLAVIIVVGELAAASAHTARLAVPVAVSLAIVGIGLRATSSRRTSLRPKVVPAVLGVTTFCVFGAPVLLSGAATFAGYIKLDDTATFLALADRALEHGRSISGLAFSTYDETLRANLIHGYPLGSTQPLSIVGKLVGTDTAWVFQPYLAFVAACLALVLYDLLRPLIQSQRWRAVCAFAAAQPALLYGYALWGGVKEVVGALLLALLAALARPALAGSRDTGALVPLGVATAATAGALSLGGLVWLFPLAVALVWCAVARRVRPLAWAVGIGTAVVLSIPTFLQAPEFLRPNNRTSFTTSADLGNLIRPLDPLQALGIWPAQDFRVQSTSPDSTHVLLGVLIFGGILGVVWAVRRRAWGFVVFAATGAVGVAVIALFGSPWVAAKAFATASPAFVLAATAGAVLLIESRRRTEGLLLLAAVVGGVLWSNVLAYRGVWLAPRGQLAELATIGERFAGEGPALMTEYSPYGARHFLRRLDAESASELRYHTIPLVGGATLDKGASADIDAFALDSVLPYRTLVLRRSPAASRPPSSYRLVRRDRFYDVWQQSASAPAIRAHLALGSGYEPAAVPACARIQGLARGASRLVAAPRAPSSIVDLTRATLPAGWAVGSLPGSVTPNGGGELDLSLVVPADGVYDFALAGSWVVPLELTVDGRRLAPVAPQLNWTATLGELRTLKLDAGRHTVQLRLLGSSWRPGATAVAPNPLGPLVVGQVPGSGGLLAVAPARAQSLCGRSLDWVEALGPQ